jgi:predicted NUDIX family phosphoesterase
MLCQRCASIRGVKKTEEHLLVVERRVLEDAGMFQGLTFDVSRYLSVLLAPRNYRFIPRSTAEKDESLKQIIPYFIIGCGDRLWSYVRGRKSGEDRLVAKASLGIGGHINHLDVNLFEDIYARAAMRELEEEVLIPGGGEQRIVALLNDDSNSVGRVHLGIVHVLRTPTPDVRRREGVITEAAFRTIPELRAMRAMLETWSQICLDRMEDLLAAGPAKGEVREVGA